MDAGGAGAAKVVDVETMHWQAAVTSAGERFCRRPERALRSMLAARTCVQKAVAVAGS